MPREDHYRKLERTYARAPTNEYFRPQLHIEDRTATVRIDVRPDLFHAADAVHGAVYFKLLDDAAFFAANSLVEEEFLLTASFNMYLLRPVTSGTMIATGHVTNVSKRLFHAASELRDADGRLLANGSGTFMRSGIRLTPAIGYE